MKRSNFGLYALTLGAFAIGTTEFVPVGLLPQIARSLDVSIPTSGFLVTGYALAVAIGAPSLTLALNMIPRKTMLAALMALFIVGNAIAAYAPTYAVLLGARIVDGALSRNILRCRRARLHRTWCRKNEAPPLSRLCLPA